ncbi:type IV pilus assembly protein FimV [Ferribacterium limneticum]|uniref:type IV pilus assembly protein FimV n=1 Tax=Ferribacterium limneticum TaxID=76259 RepID=UPI001CFC3B12|nr:hypothetical protein [Ferribacterium limneticum]UCV18303.1 hypothetical protein KI610_16085 [Ferribacterium limneticum]
MIQVIWPVNNGYNSNNLMSFGAVSLNRFARRYSLPVLMLALSGGVSAVGLGDLRGQPVLGERMQLEIDLLGAEKQKLDASCFRLVQPSGAGDLPWLKKAGLSVRKGAQPVLEIRSDVQLREPIMQLAVQLGCGHEVSREYILMASPQRADPPVAKERRQPEVALPADRPQVRPPAKVRSVASAVVDAPPRLPTRRAEKRPVTSGMPDRLMLSDGDFAAEPSLRLATGLFRGATEVKETQREILRLEYRMLMAMHEQATSQLATAEKLRNMEATLGELQQRAAEFAKRVETNDAAPVAGSSEQTASSAQQPTSTEPLSSGSDVAKRQPAPQPPVAEETSGLSEWTLYGILLGSVLGLAGWLGWRNYRPKSPGSTDSEPSIDIPELTVDPKRADEREELGGVDLHFEPVAMGMPMQVDVELDAGSESLARRSEIPAKVPERGHDSLMSINATTLDEHFEANPVMELAEIMLSFGRVKGAAQALQEYIDHNPQEALQPWIRLMDVYRMAGMRTEFENVARNLNLHFNVEVQSWDGAQAGEGASAENERPLAPRPQTLEDLPRLANTIVDLWTSGDVVGYMYQLLRDNRGGQRTGFTLPVVEDVLFLIELKETANRMDTV